jgi:hypothetical protein
LKFKVQAQSVKGIAGYPIFKVLVVLEAGLVLNTFSKFSKRL